MTSVGIVTRREQLFGLIEGRVVDGAGGLSEAEPASTFRRRQNPIFWVPPVPRRRSATASEVKDKAILRMGG